MCARPVRRNDYEKEIQNGESGLRQLRGKDGGRHQKIPGVLDANMNFMTQKLTLEAEDEKFEAVLAEAQKCCDRVDKGCRILIEN